MLLEIQCDNLSGCFLSVSNNFSHFCESLFYVPELNLDGIQFLMRAMGDEESAAHMLVPLPSLVGENEAPANLPVMFMVPGIEGMASVLEPLAKNLKSPVIGLQLGYNQLKNNTTKEMAQTLLPVSW